MPLRVTSYNLKNPGFLPGHTWDKRRPAMAAMLRRLDADLLGTQEGMHTQLEEIVADQDGRYARLGQGRDGGEAGEFCAILYRHDRLELLAHDDFWLSETPHIPGSKSWRTACTRMVSWGRFRDRETGAMLTLFNTHLDHISRKARVEGVTLLRERVLASAGPTVVTGDFNAQRRTSTPFKLLTADGALRDAWDVAEQRGEDRGTWHGFTGFDMGRRLDWILVSPELAVRSVAVDDAQAAGRYPSDHHPVSVLLAWPAEA